MSKIADFLVVSMQRGCEKLPKMRFSPYDCHDFAICPKISHSREAVSPRSFLRESQEKNKYQSQVKILSHFPAFFSLTFLRRNGRDRKIARFTYWLSASFL